MKSGRWIIPVLLMAVSCCLLLTACGKPPEAKIMAAEDAIKRAMEAGAEDSSPKLFDKARGFLQEAKMLSEQGNYSEASKKAEFAIMRADQAFKNATRLADVEQSRTEEGYATEAPEAVEEEPVGEAEEGTK